MGRVWLGRASQGVRKALGGVGLKTRAVERWPAGEGLRPP